MVGELVTLIVAPHPDDETIGAGIWLHRHRHTNLTILHLTDGSPRDLGYAREAGFSSREDYAVARHGELLSALAEVSFRDLQLRTFDYADQELHLHALELVGRLTILVDNLRPDLVMSPAYEGGHPDHDTAAFAVAAVRLRSRPFHHREYRLYHAWLDRDTTDAAMDTRNFLPCPHTPIEVQTLSPADQRRKQRMIAAFSSQAQVLRNFSFDEERFRDAPTYDFHLPPHEGLLLYERWGLSVSGVAWRACVAHSV